MLHRLALLSVILLVQPVWGRDLKVDPEQGADSNDGLTAPLHTLRRAIALAAPGDTIHLKPGTYRESAEFLNRLAQPNAPIVLDGHGAILEGSDPVNPAEWKEVAPGRFQNDHLVPHLTDAVLARWFFLWDGRMNHMGRTSKGKKAAFKAPQDLQPGEWTFEKDPLAKIENPSVIAGSFSLQLPPGQKLADARISFPRRANGVQIHGNNTHLVVRNITATHFWNDGFNIHGDCHGVLFENIRATECGDDGISAHETASYQVHGLISVGNSTGICDIGSSQTSYHNVVVRDCIGHDLFFLDNGIYQVRNAVVESSSESPLTVDARKKTEHPCELELENVLIIRTGSPANVLVSGNASLMARRCTLINLGFIVSGARASWESSVIAGSRPPVLEIRQNGVWSGRHNCYDLDRMRMGQEIVTRGAFSAFQARTAGEPGSTWRPIEIQHGRPVALPADTGADLAKLPSTAAQLPHQ